MRKHDVRKWLHAILDLLPVILIPVFMIYSHRHDPAIASTYTEDVPVYYQSNDVEDSSDLVIGNIYLWTDNYTYRDLRSTYFFDIQNNEYIRQTLQLNLPSDETATLTMSVSSGGDSVIYRDGNDAKDIDELVFYFIIENYNTGFSLIPNEYVNSITKYNGLVLKEYQTITYDFDKDIMGAFVSNFNFTIQKYFNLGNVFNLNDVYQWFNTNIFGGNAPAIINSIYNIVIYELVMDLLFLLYALFMWFIDMIQKLMEKPLNSIK